ncbi:class I SAM-dependent DNA methyltransferase [Microbacterium testaceum]|uniref:HsdM family class I SAM-dependent methyltransferase n=1 Tax=Microbacterium testaceum TaxID=2033 RepID=UPI001652B37D|nr:N-6 DNA methylase [Microbacterium testaceum]
MSNPKRQHDAIAKHVVEQLRHAGFKSVESELRIAGTNSRPDIVAWAANEDGKVVPWVVVEIKSGESTSKPELVLPQVAQYANTLGTVDNYAVIGAKWFKADRSLRRLEPVIGPTPPPFGSQGYVDDPAVVAPLLTNWLASLTREMAPRELGVALPELEGFSVSKAAYWRAAMKALADTTSRSGFAQHSSSPLLAALVARLVGTRLEGLVLDPFSGVGSFLWAVADRAREAMERGERPAEVSLYGVELERRTAAIARAIGQLAGVPTEIVAGDAFHVGLPMARVIVTAPPLGMRLPQPYELLNGRVTTDMDLAAVDLSLRHLEEGGRAVILLPRTFVNRASGEAYREYLANQFRVGALIGTPRGAVPGTSFAGIVLVVDKGDEPGETFVGQAADDDWQVQLGVNGPLTKAAVDYLDGFSEMWS